MTEKWTEDWSDRFEELRKNRVQVSHHKYGSVKNNYRTGNVKALDTMELCVAKYRETGNTEYLCDAANYLMFEFMYPQHRQAHFRATDSGESAGIVGLTEKEMEFLKEQDY